VVVNVICCTIYISRLLVYFLVLYDDTYLAQRAMDFWNGVLDGGCGPTWPSTLSSVDNLCWNRDLDLKSCV
jgi:hypothetical protein